MTLQPFIFPHCPSPQMKVIDDYLKYLSTHDTDGLSRLMTDDFVQSTSPVSLGVPDRPKAVDLEFLKRLGDSLNGQPLTITIYNINDSPGKTWVHLRIDTLGMEVVFFFQFGEGIHAHKVASLREFVDSKAFVASNTTSSVTA